ncbi:hypothetical protein FB451DRAFT_1231454 [Mycena latifolia]|nr:hypothetical protein FB451DRAFT_1231454 [Mycena latifolia]
MKFNNLIYLTVLGASTLVSAAPASGRTEVAITVHQDGPFVALHDHRDGFEGQSTEAIKSYTHADGSMMCIRARQPLLQCRSAGDCRRGLGEYCGWDTREPYGTCCY